MKRACLAVAAILSLSSPLGAKGAAQAAHKAPPAPAVVAPAPADSLEAFKQVQDLILKSLEDGNDAYRKERVPAIRKSGRWTKFQKAETPKAMVLCCSDSRVVPEEVFHCGPGELYVVRVAGNVATPEVLASLEYGATQLRIPVLVVLGHQHCGAVRAALEYRVRREDTTLSPNLKALYERLYPACDPPLNARLKGEELEGAAVQRNVRNTLSAVLEGSPVLWQVAKKQLRLRLVGALYSMETGEVYWLP